MATVRSFLVEALEEIGVAGAESPADPADVIKALKYFRRMIASFQAQRLLLNTVLRTPFVLPAHQQTRTIGDGGDFDTGQLRPQWIPRMGVVPAGDTVELPVMPYTREEWAAENFKTLTELYPRRFLYEPGTPSDVLLGTLTFWPIQTAAPTIYLYAPEPLATLDAADETALDTELVFNPPAVEEAWLTNLAKRLCRPFTRPLTPDLLTDARESLSVVKRLNDEGPPPVRVDPALTGVGGYDIVSNRRRGQ